MTKKRGLWILLLLAVAATAWWVLRPAPEQQPTPEGGAPAHEEKHEGKHGGKHGAGDMPLPVAVTQARKGDVDVRLSALGTVTPMANITVRTQISGLLLQLGFQEGQLVKKGDFLAQIDPRPYKLALEQAEGALKRDAALLKDAQRNAVRYKKLVAEDSLARQQLDTQLALVDQYRGAVETDMAQIDTAKLNLVYCHITSPITGRVGLRQVDPGNYAQVTDANGIVTVSQTQPITVLFTVPEDNLPSIIGPFRQGASLPVTAFDRSQTTSLGVGKLVAIDNQIDTTTGTLKLRAQFDNQAGTLFPNQFVNVQLLVSTLHDAILVPTAAVQRGADGSFVYKVKPDNTVTIQPVKPGQTQGDTVAISDGLAVGDTVVVDGGDKLREGAKIVIPKTEKDGDAAPPPAATTDEKTPSPPDAAKDANQKDGTGEEKKPEGKKEWPHKHHSDTPHNDNP